MRALAYEKKFRPYTREEESRKITSVVREILEKNKKTGPLGKKNKKI